MNAKVSALSVLSRTCRLAVKLAVVVTATASLLTSTSHQAAANEDGVPRTWMILPAMHIQNLFLKFALSSYGQSPEQKLAAIKSAEKLAGDFAYQSRMIHRLETVAELRQVQAQYFPEFNSLEDEIHYRLSAPPPPFFVITAGSEEVQDELEKIWKIQEQKLAALGDFRSALEDKAPATSMRKLLWAMLNQGKAEGQRAFDLIPDAVKLAFVDRILQEAQAGILQIEQTGNLMAASGELRHANPGLQRFFELAIGQYFLHLDVKSKLNIVSAFLDSPDRTTPREKFELMVLKAGPQFQKLFQVYARQEGFGEGMTNTFRRLESSTPPAPYRLIKAEIDKLQNLPFTWVEISPRPLGVGTMAQVHRARIRLKTGEERDVVVRVMKPGIEEKLVADNKVLRTIAPLIDRDAELEAAKFPKITPFVNEIITMCTNELNVDATVTAQKLGTLTYDKDVDAGGRKFRFHVPQLYDVGPNSKIMVQEFVEGVSFEKYAKLDGVGARQAVEELAKMWLEKALIGSGFYHADLHQGNLRVGRASDGRIQVNLLDFGMSGQLAKTLQARIIALSIVLTTSRRADLMSEALWELSVPGENSISLNQLRSKLQAELDRPATRELDFGEWVSLAASFGLKFPPEFTSLNRGLSLIYQMLEVQHSTLDPTTVIRNLLVSHPSQLRLVMTSLNSMSVRDWLSVGANGVRAAAKLPPARAKMMCSQVFTH